MKRWIWAGLCAGLLASPAAAEHGPPHGEATHDESPNAAQASASSGSVARAQFSTGIVEREPVDAIEVLPADYTRVYFFSELSGMDGQLVFHRWERQGEVLAEVPIQVGGPRWRAYSSKNLVPGWTGEWSVSIVDESGQVLERRTFEVSESASAPTPAKPSMD